MSEPDDPRSRSIWACVLRLTSAADRSRHTHTYKENDDGNTICTKPAPSHTQEGRVAKTIEEQTAKLPSDTFLWMAVGVHGRFGISTDDG